MYTFRLANHCHKLSSLPWAIRMLLEGSRSLPRLAHGFVATLALEDNVIIQQPVIQLTREMDHLNRRNKLFHLVYKIFTKVA
jgi:hypothetical protein